MSTLIIAEAGVNHNGDVETAKKMIDVAAESGVDIIKFQTFKAIKLVSKKAKQANYQIENQEGSRTDTQYSMLKKLELSEDDHYTLIEHCKLKKIQFLSTGFDNESIDFLYSLGMNIFKIPSGEITNLPYLQKIGSLNTQVILSTGMTNLSEIEKALDILEEAGTSREHITILHCNTDYPTSFDDVNLLAMKTIQTSFKVKVGYSDHSEGIEVPIAAVSLGACVIEKHFTLDKEMDGPDHKASLNPKELKEMTISIRNIERALGNGIKKPSLSEQKNMTAARKSIHLAKNIEKGTRLKDSDLIMKRPGDGISPMEMNLVVGKKVNLDLKEDTQLKWQNLL